MEALLILAVVLGVALGVGLTAGSDTEPKS